MKPTTSDRRQSDGAARRRKRAERAVVLVVEDDDDLRDSLCSALELDGHYVVSAGDGEEAMDYIDDALLGSGEAMLPKVVVTDVRMPRRNGFDVLAYAGFVPSVVMTAFGDAATRRRAQQLGARYFFDKPCDPAALRAAVRALALGGSLE